MTTLSEFRELKDAFFRASGGSPLTREQQKAFAGLYYFDENTALRFQLPLEKYPKPERIQIQTSTGQIATYLKYGVARFEEIGVGGKAVIEHAEQCEARIIVFE